MFKIAYCAGHYIGTAGKRLPAALDRNQTREWVLNDRVARHFAKAAEQYENVELLRTDDPTGKNFIDIPERTAKANHWGANFYLDIHHNAAGQVFTGGGVVAFSYPSSSKGKEYRDAIYGAVISAGGIKGNRSQPKQEVAYDTLSMTNMPAVLMEYGFMDSVIDAPIILTDEYSRVVAYATMAGIAKAAGLRKKQQNVQQPEQKPAANNATNAIKAKDSAKSYLKSIAGSYTVTASALNVRHGAGVTKSKMTTIPRGTVVKCYGYYSTSLGAKWLYVQFTYKGVQYTGFASSAYLKKA